MYWNGGVSVWVWPYKWVLEWRRSSGQCVCSECERSVCERVWEEWGDTTDCFTHTFRASVLSSWRDFSDFRCWTCHPKWIISTKMSEFRQCMWSRGTSMRRSTRMSRTRSQWSAACWWEMELWAKPVWSSATPITDTPLTTNRLLSTCSQVKKKKNSSAHHSHTSSSSSSYFCFFKNNNYYYYDFHRTSPGWWRTCPDPADGHSWTGKGATLCFDDQLEF